MRRVLFGIGVFLFCCACQCPLLCPEEYMPPEPTARFAMYDGVQDDSEFNAAWNAAYADPAVGVAYTFPLVTEAIDPGSVVKLYAGRPSGYVTADDVIIEDEHILAATTVRGDGTAEFEPLGVATGNWQSGTNQIPAGLLCGSTTIAARFYRANASATTQGEFLVATWFTVVAPACP